MNNILWRGIWKMSFHFIGFPQGDFTWEIDSNFQNLQSFVAMKTVNLCMLKQQQMVCFFYKIFRGGGNHISSEQWIHNNNNEFSTAWERESIRKFSLERVVQHYSSFFLWRTFSFIFGGVDRKRFYFKKNRHT